MECKDYRELIALKLNGEISPDQERMLSGHLSGCEGCSKEYREAESIWNLLGELPQGEPSEEMSEKFNAILTGAVKSGAGRRNIAEWLAEKISGILASPTIPGIAFGIILLVAGLGIGYMIRPSGNTQLSYNRQIDSLSSQVSELRQMMMLSLLQDQSASMRLQAVSYTEDLNSVDKKVIDALLVTLNKDPNVNVRLATLEALVKLSYEPLVREGLVRSIANQESPIVQSAIADVMVRLNEKSSVEELKKLLSRKDLNKAVKLNIEQSIQKLI